MNHPLHPASQRGALRTLRIVCAVCGTRHTYDEAQKAGWTNDDSWGLPFESYLCAECQPTTQGE